MFIDLRLFYCYCREFNRDHRIASVQSAVFAQLYAMSAVPTWMRSRSRPGQAHLSDSALLTLISAIFRYKADTLHTANCRLFITP